MPDMDTKPGKMKDLCGIIERRVRKHIRSLFRRDERILVLGEVSEYMLKRILKGMPVQIIACSEERFGISGMDSGIYTNPGLNAYVKREGITHIVIPWTLDHELVEAWKSISGSHISVPGDFVKLFLYVMEDELVRYSECKGIQYERMEKDDVPGFFDDIEKRYKGAKFGFLKSYVSIHHK